MELRADLGTPIEVVADPGAFTEDQWELLRVIAQTVARAYVGGLREARETEWYPRFTLPPGSRERFETMYNALDLPSEGVALQQSWAVDSTILATTFFKARKYPGKPWEVEKRDRTVGPNHETYYSSWEAIPQEDKHAKEKEVPLRI